MTSPSLIHARDHDRCVSCSVHGGNQHHRKRRSQGGTDAPSNMIILCGSGTTGCHGHWHHHIETALQLGYLVSRDDDPLARPFYHLGWGSWVLLADDLTLRLIEPPPGNDARNYTPEENHDAGQAPNPDDLRPGKTRLPDHQDR